MVAREILMELQQDMVVDTDARLVHGIEVSIPSHVFLIQLSICSAGQYFAPCLCCSFCLDGPRG
jgi:hypothetical protein